jgi:hypothetical protein
MKAQKGGKAVGGGRLGMYEQALERGSRRVSESAGQGVEGGGCRARAVAVVVRGGGGRAAGIGTFSRGGESLGQ